MYIRNKLIKSANEIYFRNYQDIQELKGLFPIKDNTLKQIYNVSKKYQFSNIINDLYNNEFNSEVSVSNIMLLRNISNLIDTKLSLVSQTTKECINILNKNSKNSYIVGGFIRDAICNKENKDIDFVTDTSIEVLQEEFRNFGWKVQSQGKQFLVMIVTKNNEQFEVSNFRKDKDNLGGIIGNIYEDAQRRDFTINTLYYNLTTNTIKDPNGSAIDDILNKVLKFVGNAKQRLIEDPNRAFRFYRFISKGFTPEPATLKAIRENFEYCVNNTSKERMRLEIERIVF